MLTVNPSVGGMKRSAANMRMLAKWFRRELRAVKYVDVRAEPAVKVVDDRTLELRVTVPSESMERVEFYMRWLDDDGNAPVEVVDGKITSVSRGNRLVSYRVRGRERRK